MGLLGLGFVGDNGLCAGILRFDSQVWLFVAGYDGLESDSKLPVLEAGCLSSCYSGEGLEPL